MSDIFSDSSKWFDFGAKPATNQWQLFSSGTLNSAVFEVSFELDWSAWNSIENLKFKSYCLLNFYYRKNGIFSVTEKARKIYLRSEAQLIFCPLPDEFKTENSNSVMRVPAFRYQTFKKAAMETPEAVFLWNLKLRCYRAS